MVGLPVHLQANMCVSSNSRYCIFRLSFQIKYGFDETKLETSHLTQIVVSDFNGASMEIHLTVASQGLGFSVSSAKGHLNH